MLRFLPLLLFTTAAFAGEGTLTDRLSELLQMYEAGPREGAVEVRITTPAAWQRKREDIRARLLDFLGRGPQARPPLSPQLGKPIDEGAYLRTHVTYQDTSGNPIPAWLLTPKTKGRFPAVLAVHQTDEGAKDSVVGLTGKPYTHYGNELAQRGFVVLAPDVITAGERVYPGAGRYVTAPFDKANPEWSAMGKMLSDHQRGLDYLESLPTVDAARIAVIGHSLGGYNSFFLAAFDDRIRASVVSCGFTPIGRSTRAFAWSRSSWFVHFPKLARYLRSGTVPFDIHEAMAMVAPKALFNYSADADAIFPDTAAIAEGGRQVGEVYRLFNVPADRLVFIMGHGPHEFPEAVRKQAYEWIEKQLGGK
ncbi:MAG: dienelactone hydrolase family protein [Acidobacteria bacterium]|nr:dienelactone hydrolase family protein [Acidobacteriota bacterium]